MTVYSKRRSAPTQPATAEPAETPMPKSVLGMRSPSRSRRTRAAAQRTALGVADRRRGAEHAHRAVTLELVDPAAVLAHDLDDDRVEAVQAPDHVLGRRGLCVGGRSDDVDEQHRHVAQLAAELGAVGAVERMARDVLADLTRVQILDALALAQTVDHRVEARLQRADLGRVVDRDLRAEVTGLHARERAPDRGQRHREGARHEHRHAEPDHERGDAEYEHRATGLGRGRRSHRAWREGRR